MGRDIGLNIGSMLPWSAIPTIGLPMAAWLTRKAGYAFWQVLPFRSLTVAGLKRTGIPVRFAEPAWNPTTFRAHLRGKPGAEGMPTKWQDPLFFSDPQNCKQLLQAIAEEFRATPVWHQTKVVGPPGLVEVHPGLGMTIDQLVTETHQWSVVRKFYVVDLRHLRRTDDGFSFVPWHKALAALLPFAGLVHIQAIDGKGWQDFIKGVPTELAEMLRFIRDWGYDGPFVVEFDPRATGPTGLLPWNLADNLRLVRERVEECLKGEK